MDRLETLFSHLERQDVRTSEYTLFVSFTDGVERATVITIRKKTMSRVKALVALLPCFTTRPPSYLRVDIVTNEREMEWKDACIEMKQVKRNNYFRCGISFDPQYRMAFLAEELQGNAILKPSSEHKVGFNAPDLTIDRKNLEDYVFRKTGIRTSVKPGKNNVRFFETQGFYYENGKWIVLSTSNHNCGLRQPDIHNLPGVIEKGARFLLNEIGDTGRFVYGYYPCYDKIIPGYNSVRHFSSIYALLEACEFLNWDEHLDKARLALEWGIHNLGLVNGSAIYIQERNASGISVKLGAQSLAILAMCKYAEITGDNRFNETVNKLIYGIESKFIDGEGNTVHILNEHLDIKRKFEIVYYDGEAVFSILRSFSLTQNKNHFNLACKLFERLIEKNYEKYHDHWLSYAANEILMHTEDPAWYNFGLKNAFGNLDFIENRDTAYPTMLELLMAAVKMTERLKKSDCSDKPELRHDDHIKLLSVAHKRALHEIETGVFWPELAMFMKCPDKIVNSFYVRHDRFRVRIDDEEHFLSGLINYFVFFNH